MCQIEYIGAWIRGVLVRVWMLWLCAREEQLLHLLVSSDNVFLHQWAWLDRDLCPELVELCSGNMFQGEKRRLLIFWRNKDNFKWQRKIDRRDRDVPVTSRKKGDFYQKTRKEEKLRSVSFDLFSIFLCFIYKYLAMGFICDSVIVRLQFLFFLFLFLFLVFGFFFF